MTPWDYISDTLSQEPSMEGFKKGLRYLKEKGMDFLQATSMFSPESVAPLNKQAKDFASWVNESRVGKAVAQGAQAMQESGADYAIPAVGAMWGPTKSFLKKLSPEHYGNLTGVDKRALETLTESYPSVRNTRLEYNKSDAFGTPLGEIKRLEYLAGKKPGTIFLTDPRNYTIHPLEKKLSSPPIAYAHEGSHALTGTPSELASWGKFTEPNFSMYDNPTSLGTEGFAEGASHSMLNKYNKEVFTPYWQEYKDYPSDLKDVYIKSGYLGADFGSDLRKGIVPNQEKAIEELLTILKGVY